MIRTDDGQYDGFVLAGGASRRMGSDKALIEYRGKTLLDWSIDILERAGLKVCVVADQKSRFPDCAVNILVDRVPGGGPLSGLDTALSVCSSGFAFVLPCDMPLMDPRFFIEMKTFSPEWDIVIPVDEYSNSQFLCGRYSVRCQAPLRRLLEEGDCRVGSLADSEELRVSRIPILDLGFSSQMFRNINRPEDLQALP